MKDDDIQNKICIHCEDTILGCKHSTSTFLCEGRYCEQAKETFYESIVSVEDVRLKLRALLAKDESLRGVLKARLNELGSNSVTNLAARHYSVFLRYMETLDAPKPTEVGQFRRTGQIAKEDFKKEYPLTPDECWKESPIKITQKQIFLLDEFEPIRVSEYKETNINF